MDATLDEDFANFEAFSQNCTSTTLTSGTDEEIRILDNEASQRDQKVQVEKNSSINNDDESHRNAHYRETKMKPPSQTLEAETESASLSSECHLFTTFSYNSTSKKLTMIPVKYKIKEERRKVLKISVNKLKKIDDPESWLCRSVLINNTMKKLQKETRDEKINKQMNSMTYSKNYLPKSAESDEFGCRLNNNNINKSENKNTSSNNNNADKVCRIEGHEDADCFYPKDLEDEGFYKLVNTEKSDEFLFQVDKVIETQVKSVEKSNSEDDSEEDKLNSSISGGVSINEDFVEKIPSIKRCASRKKSVDEDGTADEILNLNDAELGLTSESGKTTDLDDVDDCDVHDVLSQLYMPPTPRMLTSIDSDTDDDELNVVDIDSSYIDNIKNDCQKLPNEELFVNGLLGENRGEKKESENEVSRNPAKRRKLNDVFNCFEESYDNFLCSNKMNENERTNVEVCKDSDRSQNAEEELIELEDEEDIKRRLSQSLSGHYHRKPDKTCDNFFEDSCDNQYSCGHTVTMFNDMQSVTFHNLIASLET